MKKYVVLLIMGYSLSVQSFPINYQRYILTDSFNRVIKKVVDIFGDSHIDLRHPKIGSFEQEIPTNEEYTFVERTLRDVFRKLDLFARNNPKIDKSGRKQKIDLVWEIAEGQVNLDDLNPTFIHNTGAKFSQEFAKSKDTLFQFVFADEYRGSEDVVGELGLLDEQDPPIILYEGETVESERADKLKLLAGHSVQDLIDAIERIKGQGPLDLAQVKDSVTPQFYDVLLAKWQEYIKDLDGIKQKYLDPAPNKTLAELADNTEFTEKWSDTFISLTANLEMLIKLLNSKNVRSVLYAGHEHAQWIEEELEVLGFKKIVDVGLDSEELIVTFAHLNANGIGFLLKQPSTSQQRIQAYLSSEDIGGLEIMLNSLWYGQSGTIDEQLFMQLTDSILNKSQQAYIDIINMQMSLSPIIFLVSMPLPPSLELASIQESIIVEPALLHLAVKANFDKAVERLLAVPHISLDIQTVSGTPLVIALFNYVQSVRENDKKKIAKIIDLLVNKGANTNLADKSGNTPLMVATSYNLIDIARLLLEHGADPNIQDTEGYVPLVWAKSKEMIDLLLKYNADLYIDDTPIADYLHDEELKEYLTEKEGS